MPILIVDDDPTIRDLVTLMLTQAGFEQIMAAESAIKAFEVLGIAPASTNAFMPDVIVMDIMMPEIDGIEACARIKSDDRFADVPVLMATTLGDIEHLKKAFMAGATDYMTKPLRIEELLARVRSAHRLKKELDRRKMREAELRSMLPAEVVKKVAAITDSGLLSEDILLEKLGWQLGQDNNIGGALVILGIDAWDAYLSRYPQEKTDDVIKQVAVILSRQSASLGDKLVQLDHGRFGIFCPHENEAALRKNINHWKAAIAALKIPHAFSPVGASITVSAGIVPIDNWQGNRADLLAKAISELNRTGGGL